MATLPKAGTVCTFPWNLLYAPTVLGGLGIQKFYLKQHILQLAECLSQGDTATMTSDLLNATIEQLWLEIGTFGPLMPAPLALVQAVTTPSWMQSLICFAIEHNIDLHDTLTQLQLLCPSNCSIMLSFTQA